MTKKTERILIQKVQISEDIGLLEVAWCIHVDKNDLVHKKVIDINIQANLYGGVREATVNIGEDDKVIFCTEIQKGCMFVFHSTLCASRLKQAS